MQDISCVTSKLEADIQAARRRSRLPHSRARPSTAGHPLL